MKMALKSPYPDVAIPDVNFGKYILDSLNRYGDQVALILDSNNREVLTHRQVRDYSIKLACALSARGIVKGDVIATCVSNCLEFHVMLIAASVCGAIFTTCNPNYTTDEMKRQLSNSEPKLIFFDSTNYRKTKAVARDISSVKEIISVKRSDNCLSFYDLLEFSKIKDFPNKTLIGGDDVLLLPYSSGTTGLPKGVMLTHRNVISMCQIRKVALPTSQRHTIYLTAPLFHMYGIMFPLFIMTQGAKLVTTKRYSLEKFLRSTETDKVTLLAAAPPIVLNIYNSSLLDKYDTSSLKNIYCAAASLPSGVAEDVQHKLNVRLFQGYGLTEAVPLTSAALDVHLPIKSIGYIVPNTRLKVVDINNGKILGPNHNGEVWVKGPQVMKGYYKNPEATAATIDKAGWLRTGDIGYYDEFGGIYIVDRLKELIKYKGFQVAPAELEEVLLRHPKIADVAVTGIPDVKTGEIPRAFVVKKDPSITADDIHEYLKGKVISYKYLRGGVVFRDSIPKSGSGKILRHVLKDLALKSKL